jgi:hypothetical protein
MYTRVDRMNVARMMQRSSCVAGLLTVALACATPGMPQSATLPTKPAPPPDVSVAAKAQAVPISAKSPGAETSQQPAKSPSEGVKVHGYWTIDVRHPDGKLASHIEFENSLCTAASGSSGGGLLANLLMGGVFIGGWEIELGNPPIPTTPPNPPPPPCGATFTAVFVLQDTTAPCPSGAVCFATLNQPALTSAGNGMLLSGQFTVPTPASGTTSTTITAVASTALYSGTNISPAQLTGAYLTGVSPLPPALTVSSGQVVNVTVQISFD